MVKPKKKQRSRPQTRAVKLIASYILTLGIKKLNKQQRHL
jgi:hypothetical protein